MIAYRDWISNWLSLHSLVQCSLDIESVRQISGWIALILFLGSVARSSVRCVRYPMRLDLWCAFWCLYVFFFSRYYYHIKYRLSKQHSSSQITWMLCCFWCDMCCLVIWFTRPVWFFTFYVVDFSQAVGYRRYAISLRFFCCGFDILLQDTLQYVPWV